MPPGQCVRTSAPGVGRCRRCRLHRRLSVNRVGGNPGTPAGDSSCPFCSMTADNVAPEVRSRMMAGIRGKDTRPELAVRAALHRLGFRYRLHRKDLPGRPDIVLPKYQAVIFVHGCFWHGHGCHLFRWPKTREEFWREKINSNNARDRRHLRALADAGWRVATIWECSLKGRARLPIETVAGHCAAWIESDEAEMQISGDGIQGQGFDPVRQGHAPR